VNLVESTPSRIRFAGQSEEKAVAEYSSNCSVRAIEQADPQSSADPIMPQEIMHINLDLFEIQELTLTSSLTKSFEELAVANILNQSSFLSSSSSRSAFKPSSSKSAMNLPSFSRNLMFSVRKYSRRNTKTL